MKNIMYIAGVVVIASIIGILIAASPNPQRAMAQPADGQNFYDYHSLNTPDATTAQTVWATSTEERFQIHTVIINGPVALAVTLLDGATEIQTYYYGANGGACPIYNLRSATKGNDLSIKASGAGQISITVVGTSSWGY